VPKELVAIRTGMAVAPLHMREASDKIGVIIILKCFYELYSKGFSGIPKVTIISGINVQELLMMSKFPLNAGDFQSQINFYFQCIIMNPNPMRSFILLIVDIYKKT
jgi:hypothetical protein